LDDNVNDTILHGKAEYGFLHEGNSNMYLRYIETCYRGVFGAVCTLYSTDNSKFDWFPTQYIGLALADKASITSGVDGCDPYMKSDTFQNPVSMYLTSHVSVCPNTNVIL
jgi:hypothetical protein